MKIIFINLEDFLLNSENIKNFIYNVTSILEAYLQ